MNLTSRIIATVLLLVMTACTYSANHKHETESQYVHMDFNNLSIPEFAEKVSSIIKKKIIFKHKVEGKINLVANSEGIKKDELIPLLNAILGTKNMTLINKGTYYLVLGGCYDELSNLEKINNIKEAMYRHLLENRDTNLSYYFLGTKKNDETKEVLNRLQDIKPKVLPASMSKVYNKKEMLALTGRVDDFYLMTRGTLVHHKRDKGEGIVYYILCIRKVSDTKVVVTWGDYANMLGASESHSTLELIDGKWVVTDTKQIWVS